MKHLLSFLLLSALPALAAIRLNIVGPSGSEDFGAFTTVLPNGNIVITDPMFNRQVPAVADVGAVFLYRPDGTLISRIVGSSVNDHVGLEGVQVLESGHFVVLSPDWDNGGTSDAGAVTFGNADTGFDVGLLENVTSSNSLVGTHAGDAVGDLRCTLLKNGHYVVNTPDWDNGAIVDAGAVTWGNGWSGVSGAINTGNSVVGSTAGDQIVTIRGGELFNGNYVISAPDWDNGAIVDAGGVRLCLGTGPSTGALNTGAFLVGSTAGDAVGEEVWVLESGNVAILSPSWDNGGIVDAGAVTFMDGILGASGAVSAGNSIVGGSTSDQVGSSGLILLKNGHYVLRSPLWDGAAVDVGAATWCNGFTASVGLVAPGNSLIGSSAGDQVGSGDCAALTNGHYVVNSPEWDNGAILDTGAVTWLNGSAFSSAVVSTTNSLHGSTALDAVGSYSILRLSNGHYAVNSPAWDNGSIVNAGAVTWANGNTGIKGPVSAANSLVGGSAEDQVGSNTLSLSNGHYVVGTPFWDNGSVTDAGAATWCNGTKGLKGLVSKSNSLVGSTTNDQVGLQLSSLNNGNYVVISTRWDNGLLSDAGAVTWAKGSSGIKGTISASNSLVGQADSELSNGRVTRLANGHYVVSTKDWNGSMGSVTWCNGSAATKGGVSAANSLVGKTTDDRISDRVVRPLPNGDYFVISSQVHHEGINQAGAASLCNGSGNTVGFLSPANSVFGTVPNGGSNLDSASEDTSSREQLVIIGTAPNTVTLFGHYFPRSLAKTGAAAPGSPDIAFSTIGSAAVNEEGGVLFDYSLTGVGSKSGKNKALFATPPYAAPTDMVVQTGDFIQGFGEGPTIDGTATAITQPLNLQLGRSLFQLTLSGTGFTSSNNKLLMRDTGANIFPVIRSGQPIAGLGTARISTFREVLQSQENDLVVLSYTLAASASTGVSSSNDSGILPMTHGGGVNPNAIVAREGSSTFVTGGSLGQFSGKAAAGYEVIHFTASFKPTSGSPADAIFRVDDDGGNAARVALVGEAPPDIAADPDAATVKFASFPAITQQIRAGEDTLIKATLKGGESARNEGIWRLPQTDAPGDLRIMRKGDQVTGLPAGVVFSSITRFWPANPDQVIIQAKLSGPSVTSSNNQVLALRQADGAFLVLLRTGDSPNGIGTAKVSAISAVEVDPGSGIYAVLTTLSGAPSNANQVLWMGNTSEGADTPSTEQAYRLPHIRLRKGDRYSSTQTDSAVIKSITLKPFADTTGAGSRGLSRSLSSDGAVAVYLLTDRNITELVLLPPLVLTVF